MGLRILIYFFCFHFYPFFAKFIFYYFSSHHCFLPLRRPPLHFISQRPLHHLRVHQSLPAKPIKLLKAAEAFPLDCLHHPPPLLNGWAEPNLTVWLRIISENLRKCAMNWRNYEAVWIWHWTSERLEYVRMVVSAKKYSGFVFWPSIRLHTHTQFFTFYIYFSTILMGFPLYFTS